MSKTEHNGFQDHRISKVEQHIETLNHNSSIMRQDLAVVKEIIKRQDKVQLTILVSLLAMAIKIIFSA